ncbi:MAG: hypothetical protein ACRBF0_15050 [Calditrichia bacterium]
MTNPRSNKFVTILLLMIAFGVWAAVLFQFNKSVEPIEIINPEVTKVVDTNPGNRFSLDSLFESTLYSARNPFRPYKRPIKRRASAVNQKNGVIKKPQIRYLGYLEDEKGGLALLEFPDGQTHIAITGQRIMGMRIDTINKEGIKVHFEKRSFDIALSK